MPPSSASLELARHVEARRPRTALRLFGLPHHQTLDEFAFAFRPDLDARNVRALATLLFLPRHGTGASTASTWR